MKGYYVIGYDEPIEFAGKNAKRRAIKKATEIYKSGECLEVFVSSFDDDDPKGYFANAEVLETSDILRRN